MDIHVFPSISCCFFFLRNSKMMMIGIPIQIEIMSKSYPLLKMHTLSFTLLVMAGELNARPMFFFPDTMTAVT